MSGTWICQMYMPAHQIGCFCTISAERSAMQIQPALQICSSPGLPGVL